MINNLTIYIKISHKAIQINNIIKKIIFFIFNFNKIDIISNQF